MRKISLLFTLLILASFFIQCNRKVDNRLNDRLSEMAKELNESAPVMLDPYTRFEEASVTGDNHFRYRYSVLNTENPDSLLSERPAALTDNIRTIFLHQRRTCHLS